MARSAILNVMVQAATKAGRSLARDFGEVQNLQVLAALEIDDCHGDRLLFLGDLRCYSECLQVFMIFMKIFHPVWRS